ncbi:MAG: SAM-dependent methyltransferase, partial [Trebonia sp.]
MLDTSTPCLARAWDYLLGGGASFAADRALALRLEALYPEIRETLLSSRTYAADSITRIARAGVDQFLDLGSGLPTRPSAHEAARAVLPAARVAYVDRDPVVTEHGRALVPAGVRYLQGDLAEPEAILANADLTGLIDLSRPVGLVLALALHVLDPGTARAIVGVLVRALAPGSYLVVTAGAGESVALPESVWP